MQGLHGAATRFAYPETERAALPAERAHPPALFALRRCKRRKVCGGCKTVGLHPSSRGASTGRRCELRIYPVALHSTQQALVL